MSSQGCNFLVAVVGGSGAGKTWLVRQLCNAIGAEASHLSLDDFYRDRSHLPLARRARLNFDIPRAIDWSGAAQALRDCRAGAVTEVPEYDFATYSRRAGARSWRPGRIVFVEGLWLLRTPAIRALFDLKLFIDAPRDLRLDRRIARDTRERGYDADSVRQRLDATVLPLHDRYVEPQRRWADLVLRQPYREHDVGELAGRLWNALAERDVMAPWMRETLRADLVSLLVPTHEYAH